jgi:hypothetical protein
MKHTITINNKQQHSVKPTNVSLESKNTNNLIETSIEEFSQLVTQPNGYTWCPAIFKDNQRKNDN